HGQRPQREPRGPRLRAHGSAARHRGRARRPLLRLDAGRPVRRHARRRESCRVRPRLRGGRRAHVPACLRRRRRRHLRPPRPRRRPAGCRVPEGQLPARPAPGPRRARPDLLPRPGSGRLQRRPPRRAPRRHRRGPRGRPRGARRAAAEQQAGRVARPRPVRGALPAAAGHPGRREPHPPGPRARRRQAVDRAPGGRRPRTPMTRTPTAPPVPPTDAVGPGPAAAPGENAADASRPSAVVIGGGIAGLATAALLARDGYRVEVLERGAEVGGRAGSWSAGGFRFDTGPSWYLMPEVFDRFFELVGTSTAEQLELTTLDPAYRVHFEGHAEPVEILADTAANLATFERIEPGAGRRLADHLASARRTYDVALRHFLYTSFTSPRWLAAPDVARQAHRLVPLLTRSLRSLVASRFTDRRLRQILGYPAVFLGSSPERTPSMYHLMSALDLTGGVRYPHGGFTTLV